MRKHQKQNLFVASSPNAVVREIDEQGRPLFALRHVGRDINQAVIESGVMIPYHSHYIAKLKDHSLIPMNIETAKLAGVSFSPYITKKAAEEARILEEESAEELRKQIHDLEQEIQGK